MNTERNVLEVALESLEERLPADDDVLDTIRFYVLNHFNDLAKFEPNWENAPDWAQYWAVDQEGLAEWYREEPVALDRMWVARHRDTENTKQYLCHKDYSVEVWKWETLTRSRPQV